MDFDVCMRCFAPWAAAVGVVVATPIVPLLLECAMRGCRCECEGAEPAPAPATAGRLPLLLLLLWLLPLLAPAIRRAGAVDPLTAPCACACRDIEVERRSERGCFGEILGHREDASERRRGTVRSLPNATQAQHTSKVSDGSLGGCFPPLLSCSLAAAG